MAGPQGRPRRSQPAARPPHRPASCSCGAITTQRCAGEERTSEPLGSEFPSRLCHFLGCVASNESLHLPEPQCHHPGDEENHARQGELTSADLCEHSASVSQTKTHLIPIAQGDRYSYGLIVEETEEQRGWDSCLRPPPLVNGSAEL